MIRRSHALVLLTFTCLTAMAGWSVVPGRAWATALCCQCENTSGKKLCLKGSSADCGSLISDAKNTGLSGISCKTSLGSAQCRTISGGGECESITDADSYTPDAVQGTTSTVTLNPIELNVNIPGL